MKTSKVLIEDETEIKVIEYNRSYIRHKDGWYKQAERIPNSIKLTKLSI